MKKGFTLIELLVVIAIIAILAAILFPVFARAREKARQSACLSNVKQLTLGVKMYMSDYDNFFPFGHLKCGRDVDNFYETQTGGSSGGYSDGLFWPDSIMPYVKNRQIFICPSNPNKWLGYGWTQKLGYVGAHPTRSGAIYDGRPEADILYPAQTPMIADNRNSSSGTIYDWTNLYIADFNMDDWTGLHNGQINIGFVDGHAKSMTPTQAWDKCIMGDRGNLYWWLDDDCGLR